MIEWTKDDRIRHKATRRTGTVLAVRRRTWGIELLVQPDGGEPRILWDAYNVEREAVHNAATT